MDFKFVGYALIASIFTWFVTAIGASFVFFFKRTNEKIMSLMFGFGGGVMISASFFSLINPALVLANELGQIDWLVCGLGFLFGGLFILVIDLIIPHLHLNKTTKEGINSNWSNKILLVLSITLHNIPEGLAVGVAFGAAALGIAGCNIEDAIILALGIGLQNFPEGMAVSVPLRTTGLKRRTSFLYGQASGMVEPVSAVLGAILVILVRPILPLVLCFAAGAMIYVVAEELIPSGKTTKENKYGTVGVILGFLIMMILDVALSL